jgi:pectate lyase-like protein
MKRPAWLLLVAAMAIGCGGDPENGGDPGGGAQGPSSGPGAGGSGAGGGGGGSGGDDPCANPDDCPTTTSIIPDERRVDWKPGVPGGIPNRTTICADVTDYGAQGNGSADDTNAIQSAIDDCPEGQVVFVPPGNYRITDALRIDAGITLRGAGPEQSNIALDNDGVSRVIEVGRYEDYGPPTAVVGGSTKGSTEIELADASDYEVGDIIMIDTVDEPGLVMPGFEGGCEWYSRPDANGDQRSLGQRDEIVAKNGNTLTLGSPLYFDFDSSPEVAKAAYYFPQHVRRAGIEDLRLERLSDYGGQGWMILLTYAVESWVKNVETYKVAGRHIALYGCYRCEVRDSFVHHAWYYGSGGHAYGITVDYKTSDSLVENNIAYYLNNPLSFEASGGGNVVAYNYSDDSLLGYSPGWQMADLGHHCMYTHMELVEGNYLAHISFDNIHGGAGYTTFYRNRITAKHLSQMDDSNIEAFDIEQGNYYMNVVGNVLMSPDVPGDQYEADCGNQLVYRMGTDDTCNGGDPQTAATMIRHGNFDYFNNAVVWDPAIEEHMMPPSLYLMQKPAFFGDIAWPLVDPEGAVENVLPAKARFEALGIVGP